MEEVALVVGEVEAGARAVDEVKAVEMVEAKVEEAVEDAGAEVDEEMDAVAERVVVEEEVPRILA